MHAAWKAYIQQESSKKIRRAFWHQIRTSGNIKYLTGDSMYCIRDRDNRWKGPMTDIGQESQEVLVKHGSIYIHIRPCRLMLEHQDRKEMYSLFTILLPKVVNFRSCHAWSQQADITHGDSINVIARVKSIKL